MIEYSINLIATNAINFFFSSELIFSEFWDLYLHVSVFLQFLNSFKIISNDETSKQLKFN